MLRDIYSWNPKSDGKTQSPVSASGGSSSSGSGSGCGGECEMNDDDGAKQFLVVASDGSRDTSDDGDSGCGVECEMNDDGAKQFLIMASDGFRDTSRLPQEVDCNLRMIPESDPVEVAPDGRKCAEQVVVPDSGYVQIPDKKILDIAHTKKLEIPLHVAAMNKGNVNLNDSSIYLPLPLVLDLFNDEASKAIIQLKAPDNHIYSVGASKHNDDQVVLNSGWAAFVASQRIQEKDLLIFRSTEQSHLEVLIIDQSGHEKTSSRFGMENSSSKQEMSGDSVHMVDAPPPAVFDLSSSDDDDVVRGGTRESCRERKRVRRSCAKTQKMASTSYQPPYILAQTKTILPCQVKNKIEEKVQAIGSEVPLFVKVMSLSNVVAARSTMGFCKEYASGYLPNRRMALFIQLEGEKTLWETMMSVRADRWTSIYKGWMEFAAHYDLEVGDICLFQLTSRKYTSLTMTVHLIRKSEVEP